MKLTITLPSYTAYNLIDDTQKTFTWKHQAKAWLWSHTYYNRYPLHFYILENI